MKLVEIIRELLPLIGGQTFEDRVLDFNTRMKRRNRDNGIKLRATLLAALPWIPILAWAGTAFYRATVRKDELLTELEERSQAAGGANAAPSSPPR